MSFSWWEIPGPSRFVQKVERDLRSRINVVASLPAGVGQDWFAFFRRHYQREQLRLDVVRVSTDGITPLVTLCEAFSTQHAGTLSICALAQEGSIRGRTLAVLVDKNGPVAEWVAFITAYELECRGMDETDRAVLLLVLDGVSPRLFPKPETCLRVRVYDGYVRTQDCYMYSWVLLGAEEKLPWRTELKMALAAQLAQWDGRYCELLAEQSLSDMLRRETARSSFDMWSDVVDPGNYDDQWARGVVQRLDGEVVYHSGWLAKDAGSKEFERRVWTAQLQVVFPLIELVRHQVIEGYKSRIQFPVRFPDGVEISDPYELEIAMVRFMLYRAGGVPRDVMRRLTQAVEFRNALAHLEPLSAEQLQHFEPDSRRVQEPAFLV